MSQENKQTLMITMDQTELACRIAKAIIKAKRPADATAKQAMAEFDDEARQDFERAAIAAIKYLSECCNNFGKAELVPPGNRN